MLCGFELKLADSHAERNVRLILSELQKSFGYSG